MSRQSRRLGEYQHVIVRGIGKQILFEDVSDRQKYLEFLRKYQIENNISVLAYCLMENHVHFLLQDIYGSMPVFMKKMGVSYAYYYNHKYERTGHLFQDRYISELINNDAYLLTVFRYILNNPQQAGICAAKDYPWSSFKEYGKSGGITNTEMLCEMIGSGKAFMYFMSQPDDVECLDEAPQIRDDAWAIQVIQQSLSIVSGTQLQQYDRQTRDNALAILKGKGLSIRQLERLTGINRGIIQRA